MNFKLDHVGIAVRSLAESVIAYQQGLGLVATEETVGSQGVRIGMLRADGDERAAKLELLEANGEESPLGRFVERYGPGLHHLALRVDNLESAIQYLREQGFEVIGEPQRGAEDCRFVFLHPRSTGGVLLEVLQRESR